MTSSNGNIFRVTGPLWGWLVYSPPKGHGRGALMFYLICAWTNGWANKRHTGYLRHCQAHYDVTVMLRDPRKLCYRVPIKRSTEFYTVLVCLFLPRTSYKVGNGMEWKIRPLKRLTEQMHQKSSRTCIQSFFIFDHHSECHSHIDMWQNITNSPNMTNLFVKWKETMDLAIIILKVSLRYGRIAVMMTS